MNPVNHAIYVDPTPVLVTPARVLSTIALAKTLGLICVRWRVGRDVKGHWMGQGITLAGPPIGPPANKPFTIGGLPCEVDYDLEPNMAFLVTERELPLLEGK